jgi:hypothetical protein
LNLLLANDVNFSICLLKKQTIKVLAKINQHFDIQPIIELLKSDIYCRLSRKKANAKDDFW